MSLPATSAMHAITTTQNVTRAVAERIAELERRTQRSRAMAWGFFLVPLLGAAGMAAWDPLTLILSIYLALPTMPIGATVHHYRRRALREASRLDRDHDVAWVSPADGLVFFSDEGVFVEKRGGFRPYGVETRRFRDVTFEHGVLTLHGMDFVSGSTYQLEVRVPSGWQDEDTRRVREKLGRFALG